MPTKEVITKVWIEEGCIVCDACETASPEVFEVLDDTCVIRPDAANPDFNRPRSDSIVEAAEECPVDVIKFDTTTVEVSEEEAAAAPKPAEAAAPAQASTEKPEAKPAAEPVAASPDPDAGDPAIQGLLRAATTRGGNAGLLREAASVPEAARAMQRKDPSALPPDARQARIMEQARKMRKDPEVNRREFVNTAAVWVGWGAFSIGTGVAIGPAFGRFMMPNVLEEPDPRIRVGEPSKYIEMQPGDVNEDYKPQGIWMIRLDGRLAALNIICTHLGCIPNWLPNDRKFKCPCHGSGYRPDGINFEGPTPRPLERFRIYVEDGEIIVDKSKKYQSELGQWEQQASYLEL